MKTKIGTSFGLALLLAVGVVATMLALGMFSASQTRADAGAHVHMKSIAASPTTAGAATTVTIEFTTAAVVVAGSGQIVVTFDSTWGVPSSMAKERIALTTQHATGGTSNPAVDPTITTDASGNHVVTITIDDTAPDTGRQDLEPWLAAPTTRTRPNILVFSPLAGITMPTGAGGSSSKWITLSATGNALQTTDADQSAGAVPTTGSYTDIANNGVEVVRTISLSSASGANGTVITVTGKGFTTGSGTVFKEGGTSDNAFVSGTDSVIATSDAAVSGGVFTASFTVATPLWTAGVNTISAHDGTGGLASAVKNWTLLGSVTLSKASASRGESVVVKLRNFQVGTVTSIAFGGVLATVPADDNTVGATNSNDITVTVPTTAPLGTQRVAVLLPEESSSTRNANIDIVGAPLTLSPSTAVALQTITVSGSGFTGSTEVAYATSNSTNCNTTGEECAWTIGAFDILAVAAEATTGASANIGGNTNVTTDNSGNLVTTLKIPLDANDATTVTAGTYTLTVTDGAGRTGQAELTIPARTVTLDPTSSRRGSTVSVTGTGFPAKTSVTIAYAGTTVSSATPDSVGSFTASLIVPTSASIPSTNTVLVTSSSTNAPTGSASHAVPGAAITLDSSSASSGNQVTMSGEGFPGYSTATSVTIGGVEALPSPAPSTDGDGVISSAVLVPQLGVGSSSVLLTVGGITANTSLTIVAAPEVVVVSADDTDTVFADEITADNLVRVWHFSNADQSWSFYDPRPAFAAANTYTTATGGNIVWVNVTEETTFQSQSLYAGWNLISLD